MIENEIDAVESLQIFLTDINTQDINETVSSVSHLLISTQDGQNLIVNEILYVLSIRLNVIDAMVKFTIALNDRIKEENSSSSFSRILLRNIERTKHPYVVIYLHRLMKAGLYTKEELLSKVLYMMQHDVPITREIFADELYEMYSMYFQDPNLICKTDIDGCEHNSLEFALKHDDFDYLQEKSQKNEFNYNQTLYCSQLYHPVIRNQRATMLEIAALFGSVNCFKFLMLNSANFRGIVETAPIIGGDTEIIRIWDRNREIDARHIETAMANRRNNVIEWILQTKPNKFTDEDIFLLSVSTNNAYFFNLYKENVKVTSHMVNASFNSKSFFAQKYLISNCIDRMTLLYAGNIIDKHVMEMILSKDPSGHCVCEFSSNQIPPAVLTVLYNSGQLQITEQFMENMAKKGTRDMLAWIRLRKLYNIASMKLFEAAILAANYDVADYLLSLDEFPVNDQLITLALDLAITKRIPLITFVKSNKIDEDFRSFLLSLPCIYDSNITDRDIYEKWIESVQIEHIPYLVRFYLTSEPCISTSSNSMISVIKKLRQFSKQRELMYKQISLIKIKKPLKPHITPVLQLIAQLALDDIEKYYKNENILSDIENACNVVHVAFSHNVITSDFAIERVENVGSSDFMMMVIEMAFMEYTEPTNSQCSLLSKFFTQIEKISFSNNEEDKKRAKKVLSLTIPALPHCFPFKVADILQKQLETVNEDSVNFANKFLLEIENKHVKLCQRELKQVQEVLAKFSIKASQYENFQPIVGVGLGEKYLFKTCFENIKNKKDSDMSDIFRAMKNGLYKEKRDLKGKGMKQFFDLKFTQQNASDFAYIASSILHYDPDLLTKKALNSLISALEITENTKDSISVLSEAVDDCDSIDDDISRSLLNYIEKCDISKNDYHKLANSFIRKCSEFLHDENEKLIDILEKISLVNERDCFLSSSICLVKEFNDEKSLAKIYQIFMNKVENDKKFIKDEEYQHSNVFYELGYSDSDYYVPSTVSVDNGVTDTDFQIVGVLSEFAEHDAIRPFIAKKFEKYLNTKAHIMPSAARLLQVI